MDAKKIVSVALLVFVAVSVVWLVIQGQGSASGDLASPSAMEGDTASKPEDMPAAKPDRVVVYYFHTTNRCPTCHKIESYTREAVELKFQARLKDGSLEFRPINIEETGNEHYAGDYKLVTKSVIVSDLEDGKEVRWKNLPKVWELTHDKEAFFKHIEDEVNQYLQGK